MARALHPVPDQPARAVLYLRQSVSKEDSISLELQETACRDFAEHQGYAVVDVVADPGVSGRTFRRKGVARVMDMIEAHEADVIICWKWSRISRNRRDWALAIDRVDVAGGRIESATEPTDVTSSVGRLARGMLSEFAAFESDRISDVWKEVQARRRKMGLPHNSGARFGYVVVDGLHQPDPDTGPVLAAAYRRYVAGDGFKQIMSWLNAAGQRTTGGNEWGVSHLMRVLDSGFAAGLITNEKRTEYWPGAHQALITAEDWEAYRRTRRLNAKVPTRTRGATYILTGLARCGRCGGPASAMWGEGRPGYLLSCSRWRQSRSCAGVWITRERAEAAVRADIELIAAPVTLDGDGFELARKMAGATARAERSRLNREIVRIDRQLTNLTRDLAAELVPPNAYRAARDELQALRDAAQHALDVAAAEQSALRTSARPVARNLLDHWGSYSVQGVRDQLACVIRAVYIDPSPSPRSRGATIEILHTWDAPRSY